MKKVVVFVEGQTEEAFIKEVVAPSLHHLQIFLYPRMLRTSAKGRGGAITYDRFRFYTRNTLAENKDWIITTFFDLYGLDNDFPEFNGSMSLSSPLDKAKRLESALHNQIINEFGVRQERFIPHIQPYEYEGILFSDVNKFGEVEPNWKKFEAELAEVRKSFETPEHINNSYETAPSKRLEKILSPKYHKVRHGPLISKQISLPTIENECEHFKEWLNKLRAL